MSGWELRKALRLLRKSNPPLLACLWIERQCGQPFRQIQDTRQAQSLRGPELVEGGPMLFAQFVENVLEEVNVSATLHELVARKQAGEELTVAPPVEVLSRFIEAELPRLEALNQPDEAAGDVEELNGFFRCYALAA